LPDVTAQTGQPTDRKPVRLLPGVVAAALLVLLRYVLPIFLPDAAYFIVLGGVLCGLAIAVWWAFFSRAPRWDRWGAVALMIVALAVTPQILHPSVRTGMMGLMFFVYAIPGLGLAFVAWAVATRHLSDGPRRAAMIATVVLACALWALVRTGGVRGSGSEFAWRWSPTAEERLLAQGDELAMLPSTPAEVAIPEERPAAQPPGATAALPPATPLADPPAEDLDGKTAGDLAPPPPTAGTAADWPGFRGPDRDGIVRGVRIETDWSTSPPVELWRRPIGPGWSSFAVHGDLLYTQEQRGDEEVVACYHLTTGKPVWKHSDAARFWESNAGPGPRATPTLRNGRVYTFGATGILNVLDAASGALLWSRNAASDTGTKVPDWGFASSPLVVGDAVIVATAGQLAAYDIASSEPRWLGQPGGGSYSSPHLLTIDGVPQILLLSGQGVSSVAPADGALLWQHLWPGFSSLQPAVTSDGEVLVSASSASGGIGIRRLAASHAANGWTVEERWTSAGLKPYFNDFVVHRGHAFGFDGRILSCIDLKDGERKWKGGRYGNGQLILLPDQDLLLVLSDEGELALVGATPGEFTELARFPAIEGKTWNHPVLAGDVVLVRNGEEMAAFRISEHR
jgi:outer membrane protein assembly factor BamB